MTSQNRFWRWEDKRALDRSGAAGSRTRTLSSSDGIFVLVWGFFCFFVFFVFLGFIGFLGFLGSCFSLGNIVSSDRSSLRDDVLVVELLI